MYKFFLLAPALLVFTAEIYAQDPELKKHLGQLPLPGQVESANQVDRFCESALAAGESSLELLQTYDGALTVDDYYKSVDDLSRRLGNVSDLSALLDVVHPDSDVKAAAQRCEQNAASLMSNLKLSQPVFERLLQIDAGREDDATRYSIEKRIAEGRLAGVDLDSESRRRLGELDAAMNEHQQQFRNNINIAGVERKIVLNSTERLAGLPPDFVAAQVPNENGEIFLSPNAIVSQVIPVLVFSEEPSLRRETLMAAVNQGYPDNVAVLRDLLTTRFKYAQLLGFDTYADYVISENMAASPERVQRFLDDVHRATMPSAKAEYARLLLELHQLDSAIKQIHPSDAIHAVSRIKKAQYDVDTTAIREYFEYETVRNGIFQLAEDLFGVSITPWDTPLWHDSVESYTIRDGEQLIGHFYVDMFPRENKFAADMEMPVVRGVTGTQTPIAALILDLPPRGAFMQQLNVTQFLHEFGHLLHDLFAGHQSWYNNAGANNERDFIEAPSTLLEAWLWNYDFLSTIAINRDGDVLPPDLFGRMKGSRDFGRGLQRNTLIYLSALSLELHLRDPEDIDFEELDRELQKRFSVFGEVDELHYYASFGHLLSYSAMYYTYIWSDVIATDMLTKFESSGLRDRDVWRQYRATVLAPGTSKPAETLVTEFLGRPIRFD